MSAQVVLLSIALPSGIRLEIHDFAVASLVLHSRIFSSHGVASPVPIRLNELMNWPCKASGCQPEFDDPAPAAVPTCCEEPTDSSEPACHSDLSGSIDSESEQLIDKKFDESDTSFVAMPVQKSDTGYYLKERGLGTLVFDK